MPPPIVKTYALESVPSERTYAAPADAWTTDQGFKGQRWAVVVGVSEYKDKKIPSLAYADDDAKAVYEFLRSQAAGLGGFPEKNIRLLVNKEATYENLRSALFTFLKAATPNDIVLVYFAGHGMPDAERPTDLYLLPYDARVDDVSGTGLPMEAVADAIRKTYARDKIVITDACHSAGVGGEIPGPRAMSLNQINQAFLEQLNSSTGAIVTFTASQATQFSQEGRQWGGGHGVFTHYLLDGLRGRADQDGDQIVTLGEIMDWTTDQVRRETKNAQIPSVSQTAFDRSWPMALVTAPGQSAGKVAEGPSGASPTRPESVAADLVAAAPRTFSAASAAVQSMLVPGLGQYTTRRPLMGTIFLAAAGGAVAVGFLKEDVTVQCLERTQDGSCPDDQVLARTAERPLLMPGIGAAAALAVLSAVDAFLGARAANARAQQHGYGDETRRGPELAPPSVGADAAGIRIELLRFRF